MFEHYKKLISNQRKTNWGCEIYGTDIKENRKIITFPYIQSLQEQLCRVFKKSKLQIIFNFDNTLKKNFYQQLKIKLKKNLNTILFTKLIVSNVIKNILDKHVVFKTHLKPHSQNMLLPISILLILKIRKF